MLAAAACGDNARPASLERVAAVPAGAQDLVFDRDGAVVRDADGTASRLVDDRWRPIAMNGARAIDLGTDTDGTLLVMSSIPRRLYQLRGMELVEVGGILIANYVHMPVQVPSGNRYVREIEGARRSFVLSPGASTWASTPPMFHARPVRAYDGALYAAQAAGVVRFEADGPTLVVPCERAGEATCTHLVLGAADGGRVVAADPGEPAVVAITGEAVEHVRLPRGRKPVRIAVGANVAVVLAERDTEHVLYALHADSSLELLDSASDPPSAATLLAVDGDGHVHVATSSLSRVVP